MYKSYYNSPIGAIEVATNEDSIIKLDFVEELGKNDENAPEILKRAIKQLDEYFQGKRKTFDLKLGAEGTTFQQSVWQQLIKVPFGSTATYGEIAKAVGNEKASRAVGGANNKNKIAIVIPCHRVVGSQGKMVGYAGGLWRKEWLLQHEKQNK